MIFTKRNISAIIYKTFKNLIASKPIIFMTFIYPLLAILFKITFPAKQSIQPIFSFCMMNIVIVPILVMSSIMGEEKEKGTLRVLMISNVKPQEYLIGTSFCVFFTMMLSSALFPLFLLPNEITRFWYYLLYSALGSISSIFVGCIIGLKTKSQVEVGAISAPIAMLIGMLPIFSRVNKFLKLITRFLYSDIIFRFIEASEKINTKKDVLVLLMNILVLFYIFRGCYKRNKLDD